ncbi:hypothetical protein KP509_34G012900 [Ceratopteris richardii]|uniref:Uncharacterized protein n=1 Tax=Ceratopteris richardii TaxID=49495 RepID=A0A8T2QIE9_CERRI|nr:hypothetical protein KP509_34G012900 [Ceratopteris richardii]
MPSKTEQAIRWVLCCHAVGRPSKREQAIRWLLCCHRILDQDPLSPTDNFSASLLLLQRQDGSPQRRRISSSLLISGQNLWASHMKGLPRHCRSLTILNGPPTSSSEVSTAAAPGQHAGKRSPGLLILAASDQHPRNWSKLTFPELCMYDVSRPR